jgi:hypothetical protein
MKREINLDPYPVISVISHYDFRTLENYASIIFEYEGQIVFIRDSVQKMEDVSQMPKYIKEDWIKNSKKNIGISELNKHVEFYNKQLDSASSSIGFSPELKYEIEEYLTKILSIRRDLILKGLIS